MEKSVIKETSLINNKPNCKEFIAPEEEPIINIYPPAELPIPYGIEDKENEIIFLDPTIGEGKRLVNDKATTIPQLFAVLRQFVVPVCQNIGLVIDQIILKGAKVNDVDGSTGMSLLHYAVRATTLAENHGLAAVKKLLSNGADPRQRCLYSGMNALHIAAYFDVAPVAKLLLKTCNLWPAVDINSLCDGFDFGSSLHIACYCLSSKVVDVLLQKGAWSFWKDDMDRSPVDCLPTNFTSKDDHKQANLIKSLINQHEGNYSQDSIFAPLSIGSKVIFSTNKNGEGGDSPLIKKTGILRFVGKLPGRPAEWAGIELDTNEGSNSGDFEKVSYFKCKPNHGMFVPLSLVSPVLNHSNKRTKNRTRSATKDRVIQPCKFAVGDRVVVASKMEGTVRYVGETQFASGVWCGVELDSDGPGRNNGSVGDVTYFTCPPTRGIFSPPSKLSLKSIDVSPHQDEGLDASISHSVDASSSSYQSTSISSPRSNVSSGSQEDPISNPSGSNASRESSVISNKKPPLTTSATKQKRQVKSSCTNSVLRVGMKVSVRGLGRRAAVKFIGETDFADGVWVGIDLGSPCGRNDGSVQGRRYFTCTPKHGLMVRPHRVTYNGINGNHLLPPDLQKDS